MGVIADSSSRDGLTAGRLDALASDLPLGLSLVAMSRSIGARDMGAAVSAARIATRLNAEILHGHSAKGGAYARIAGALMSVRGNSARCFYTPHGGSLHYAPRSLSGRLYLGLERRLAGWTTGIIFESEYARRAFEQKVGDTACPQRVIPNGLLDGEFSLNEPDSEATDLLFIGELRMLKGVDVLLEAIALLQGYRDLSLTVVGDGPDADTFKALATRLGISQAVTFAGAMPARAAFRRGRVLVVPSRAESLPYIVLEAAAAGVPLIATDVGGIPEIVQGTDVALVPAGDSTALAKGMMAVLTDPDVAQRRALELRDAVKARYTVDAMARSISDFYGWTAAPLTNSATSLTYP
ncbi:MAG: hypothetical protein RLZ98_3414 [Pseudomonadota bacterium]